MTPLPQPRPPSPYFHATTEPFSMAHAFDAGVAARLSGFQQQVNPFAWFPQSHWAWDLGWRFAAFCGRAEREGRL